MRVRIENALAAALIVIAVLGVSACARNGLGGYEPIKIFGR